MARISPRSSTASTARRNDRLERWLGWLALPLAGALFATQAEGATLTVQADVVGACTVSDRTLEFATNYISGQAEDVDGSVSVTVDCSNGITVDLKLGPGNNAGTSSRGMSNGNQILQYNLYTAASRLEAEVWGDDTFGSAKRIASWDQTSDGTQVIHGRIFGGQTIATGNYTDSVPLTVEVVPTP